MKLIEKIIYKVIKNHLCIVLFKDGPNIVVKLKWRTDLYDYDEINFDVAVLDYYVMDECHSSHFKDQSLKRKPKKL